MCYVEIVQADQKRVRTDQCIHSYQHKGRVAVQMIQELSTSRDWGVHGTYFILGLTTRVCHC